MAVLATKDTHEAKLGPLELSVKDEETVNVPVWAGVGAIVIGGALLLVGGKKGLALQPSCHGWRSGDHACRPRVVSLVPPVHEAAGPTARTKLLYVKRPGRRCWASCS